jgi:hypothetical protein
MRANEFLNNQQLDEINWKKAAAAGAIGIAGLGALAPAGAQNTNSNIMPGEPQVTMPSATVVKGDQNTPSITYGGKEYPTQIIDRAQARQILQPSTITTTVPMAQLGIRGLGNYTVLINDNQAYIVK